MRRSEQLRLIGRFYDDMWNQFDKSVFPDILHPDIHFRGSLGQPKVGFDEFGDYVDYIESFAPDFHNQVVETITENDQTFARLSYTGTHRGELFDLAPSGNRFSYAGAAVFTFKDGLIRDAWVLGDILTLLAQLSTDGSKPAHVGTYELPREASLSRKSVAGGLTHPLRRVAQFVDLRLEFGGPGRVCRRSGHAGPHSPEDTAGVDDADRDRDDRVVCLERLADSDRKRCP